jgi:uncharacterized protein
VTDVESVPEPVSTEVRRMVPVDKAPQFERLLHDVIDAARGFAGHLGVDVLRPDGGGCYEILFRFSGHAQQQAWMDSEQRHLLVARIDELLGAGTEAETRTVDGWEGWFVSPGYAPPTPPKRWKMAVLTLGALYPIVLVLSIVLRPVSHGWPLPAGLLLSLGLTIPVMTWLVMPVLTTAAGSWLRADPEPRRPQAH